MEPCVTLTYSELGAYAEPSPNIYYEEFYSQSCVTLAYSEP